VHESEALPVIAAHVSGDISVPDLALQTHIRNTPIPPKTIFTRDSLLLIQITDRKNNLRHGGSEVVLSVQFPVDKLLDAELDRKGLPCQRVIRMPTHQRCWSAVVKDKLRDVWIPPVHIDGGTVVTMA
jgi:hypothetical protein